MARSSPSAPPIAAEPSAPGAALLRRGRAPLLVGGGLALAVAIGMAWAGWGGRAVEPLAAAVPADQLAAISARLSAIERTLARPAGTRPVAVGDNSGAPPAQRDRFILAMLHLQAAAATARPWLREYDLAASLAPPGLLSPTLAEVLASHAARGLASEAALMERFEMLAPSLVARGPRGGSLLDRVGSTARGAFSMLGLATPPAATETDAAVQRIREQLRRGQLAAALSDAATLDAALQPLLSGWLAQSRARLAVEQAIQETLLRAIGTRGDGPA